MSEPQLNALIGVVRAWNALSAGYYSPREIQFWLSNDLKPAIDAARSALSPTDHEPREREG